ncbi:hypothetical protein [Paenibacillus donghaensis]|uniref:Phage protein, HK97 gp10 family n=1 Tax=Paenibacillus donghaensis TaxID=414771 RepID=A0A2Z2KQX2_9BACL|nr:hypothetical protein [Paenibacillus donghaensis]ASA22761.1 hypothetical protein B9T62_19330 [Paenibacillus donghaensis]
MEFKSLKDLEKHLNKQIAQSLKNDVGNGVARKKLKENIQTEVYDKYDPVIYERQRENGGLIDDANIKVEMIDNNTVSIESHRMDGNKNVGVVVETGVGYNEEWAFPYTHKSRLFTEVTRDELRNDGSVEHALMKGLEVQGLKVQK